MKFYEGKSVAVTGGSGMIGYQLVQQLRDLGADVIVGDNYSRAPEDSRPKASGVVYSKVDVSSVDGCRYLFNNQRATGFTPVDIVFNLAANVAGVIHNQRNNMSMYLSNMDVQAVPLFVASEMGIQNFLSVSSVCVYAPENQVGATEGVGHVGNPHFANGGYSLSKRTGEKLTELANIEHAVIVRPSNVYGEWDYFDEMSHVIPAFIKRSFKSERMFSLFGNPSFVREFVHASDTARGMIYALANGESGGVYNIGTSGDTCISMRELAETIIYLTGSKQTLSPVDGISGGDPARKTNSSALQKLGWEHKVGLIDGLQMTIDWYKERFI